LSVRVERRNSPKTRRCGGLTWGFEAVPMWFQLSPKEKRGRDILKTPKLIAKGGTCGFDPRKKSLRSAD
jgi:hypothetical protein